MEQNPRRDWRTRAATDHDLSHRLEGGEGPPEVKCSGRNCRSWAAALIADCVALCCCPCSVLSFLTLAFVKVPWMVGRKCLGRRKKRRKKARKCEKIEGGGDDHWFVVERDGSLTKEENAMSFGFDDEARICAWAEAEKVWLELYQIGHLGFGRVSFTGIQ